MEEIWKDIIGYEGLYQVSNLGNVKSLEKQKIKIGKLCIYKEKTLKNNLSNYGYYYVNLFRNGNYKHYLVHRLVAIAFIPNPDNKPCVNHIDANKTNNNIENLEWCSYLENNLHALSHNLKDFSKKSFVVSQIKNGVVINTYKSINEAVRQTGINMSNIIMTIRGIRKSAGGFQWKKILS